MVGLPNGLKHDELQLDGVDEARLVLRNLTVIDEPAFPQPGPSHSAINYIDVRWQATGDVQTITDPSKHFTITGRNADIQAEFYVSQPKFDFTFYGTATSVDYSFLGTEKNGYFYDQPAQST